jgi:hypothetical protein
MGRISMDAGKHQVLSGTVRVLAGGFLVLVLYVLSIGPVKRLEVAGYLPRKTVDILYQPLAIINGTPLETGLIWYLELWFPPSYVGDLPHGKLERLR